MTPVTHYSDAELVTALNNGDRKAFEMIYRKYVHDLFNYVRRNIDAKQDCEEIIQDIFESLWTRRASLQIQTSLRGYLLGMVRYKIIHYFRRNARKKKYMKHFLLFEVVYEEAGDENENPSTIQSTIDKLIAQLPERCQEALMLRLTEDLSNHDIALRMNISIRTVEAYMFRAFNHIRSSYRTYLNQ